MTDDYQVRRLENRNKALSSEIEQLRDSVYQFRLLAFMLRYSEGKERQQAIKAYDQYLDELSLRLTDEGL